MLIAIEDAVSEAVARKLLSSVRPDLAVTVALGRQGNGYLRSRARELNRAATSIPVLMLADLDDRSVCIPDVMMAWFGTRTLSLLFTSTKQDLVPADGSTAIVGPAYTPRISGFVERTWEPARASVHSDSLRRAVARIRAHRL